LVCQIAKHLAPLLGHELLLDYQRQGMTEVCEGGVGSIKPHLDVSKML
jgi:hypothetical protein